MRYLVLSWPPQPASEGHATALCDAVDRLGAWCPVARGEGVAIWTGGAQLLRVRRLPRSRGVILGDLFAPPDDPLFCVASLLAGLADAPRAAAAQLTHGTWGRYVAVLTPEQGPPALYRDPSGGLEALTWRLAQGVTVASSGLEHLPGGLSPPRLALNWDRIALGLAEPLAATVAAPLDGFATVLPGVLHTLDVGAAEEVIWSPASRAEGLELDDREAMSLLAARIDHCTAVLTADHARLVGEISGGLDSAIIAAAVCAAGAQDRVAAWVSYFAAGPGGDERRYARAVAERLGLRLAEVALSRTPMGDDDFAALMGGVRPPLTALGRAYDQDMAARVRALDATAVLSGEGGDAILFQSPSPLVFADALARRGWRAVVSPGLAGIARWTRRPVWSVLGLSLQALRRGAPPRPTLAPLAGARAAAADAWRHPWRASAEGLPPARQLQIGALANAQIHQGGNLRRQCAQLLYPLLAQPVVELCLGLPVPQLVHGWRDRGLARAAYAARLPASVTERRSKGDLSAFYGQVLIDSLDWLRPHLLEGCLCAAGVIDRRALEDAMTPQSLIFRGGSSALEAAALTETWVRDWQTRVPDSVAAPRSRRAAGSV